MNQGIHNLNLNLVCLKMFLKKFLRSLGVQKLIYLPVVLTPNVVDTFLEKDLHSIAVDTFTVNWSKQFFYAFSLFSIISKKD